MGRLGHAIDLASVVFRHRCPECGYCVSAVTRTAVAEGLIDHLDWHMAQGHPEAA